MCQDRVETVFINSIDIPVAELFGEEMLTLDTEGGGIFTIVDSPGFGDNRGVELDISNGMSIARAMRQCSGIRPLILISASSIGDRLEGLIEFYCDAFFFT